MLDTRTEAKRAKLLQQTQKLKTATMHNLLGHRDPLTETVLALVEYVLDEDISKGDEIDESS